MPRSDSRRTVPLQGIQIILDPAVQKDPASYAEAVFRMIDDLRDRWRNRSFGGDGCFLDRIANRTLGDHVIEHRHGKGDCDTALKRCENPLQLLGVGDWSWEIRCCLIQNGSPVGGGVDDEEVTFWGLTKAGKWILVRVKCDHDYSRARDQCLRISGAVAVWVDTAQDLAMHLHMTPYEIFQRMRLFVRDYCRRLEQLQREAARERHHVYQMGEVMLAQASFILDPSARPIWLTEGCDDRGY